MIINKRTIIFILFFLLVTYNFSFSKGMENESNLAENRDLLDSYFREQLDSFNIRELELVLEDLTRDNEEYYPKIDIKDYILSTIKGQDTLDFKGLMVGVLKVIFNEVINNLELIVNILIVIIAYSVLTNLQTSFEKDTISQLGQYACYIILSMMIINSFMLALNLAEDTVVKMINFMEVILPILLALLTAIGGVGTRILFHPVVIGIVNIIGNLIKSVVFPLISLTFIIGIISNISNKVQFTKLSELLRQIIVFILGGAFTIFIAIITIYGIGSKIDGITIRTAKFAVDSFVPIIGKFLSDAVETVVGGSAILKNGVGIVGLVALLLITLFPVAKILVLIFAYKFIAALIQPIASDNITGFLGEVSKDLVMVLVGIISVATMFFITITIIVEAGNAALMFR